MRELKGKGERGKGRERGERGKGKGEGRGDRLLTTNKTRVQMCIVHMNTFSDIINYILFYVYVWSMIVYMYSTCLNKPTCILGSPSSRTLTELPVSHVTVGVGSPGALHVNLAVSPATRVNDTGDADILGATEGNRTQHKNKNVHTCMYIHTIFKTEG